MSAFSAIKAIDYTVIYVRDLAAMRREFRTLVLEALREQCASDGEFRAEARALLGVDPP